MPCVIVPTWKDNCACVTCEGKVTLAEITKAWREVQAVLAENGWKRVLLDVRALESSPKMEELFDLAKLFWKELPLGGRIALVIQWDQVGFARFLETLARCVGVYLTVFVSEQHAAAWLLGAAARKPQTEELSK